MSNMMQKFVEQELENQIKQNYPHMQYPPGLYARVVSVKKKGDSRFPEVPGVKTDILILKNDIVAVVLMYGECSPYIIGRCF